MQFSLLPMLEQEQTRETVADVVRELREKAPCQNCRLGLINPQNRGVMYRGSAEAKIAVLDIGPRQPEMTSGNPLSGAIGREFDKWMRYLTLDTRKDIFVTGIVQCATPRVKDKKGYTNHRLPLQNEVAACWFPRTLRMIQAMPNLECVITLGWASAKAVLGGEPGPKSHEGRWFQTSLFPGRPVFCLDHPEASLQNPTPEKKGKTVAMLDCFKREYLYTRKIIDIAASANSLVAA